MKKFLPTVLCLFACETYDVLQDNPIDPNNPDYELPSVKILDLTEGQIVTSDKVDIYLQGNDNVSQYAFQVNSDDPFVDMNGSWSVWSTSEIISLEFLNEYSYELAVKSRYPTDRESNIERVNFTVDAVQPGSLLLYPKQLTTNIFEKLKIQLFAHQLPNVSALDFQVQFDDSKVEYYVSTMYGDVNVVRNPSANQAHFTIGKYGDSGFNENEMVAEIVFMVKDVSGSFSTISILSATAKSLDGQTIEIAGTNQVRVDVR